MAKSKVLVTTNFNPQSEAALLQAVHFSKKTKSDIYLLHVIDSPKSTAKSKAVEIKQKLDQISKEFMLNLNAEINTEIRFGKVLPEILKFEKELEPQFVFIGTEPNSKPFYSTTINLIDDVSCPVVVLSSRYKNQGCKKIVLPLDLSHETTQKVRNAKQIAKIYDSKVYIISATNTKDEKVVERLKNKISLVEEDFTRIGLLSHSEILFVDGNKERMANAINDYADDINADLIVIMTRQEKRLEKLFIGSMATKLIKKATVPVLCISPKS